MLYIAREQLPIPEDELRESLDRYKAALEAHKLTVGEPAPWPEHDVLREVIANGGDFEIPPEPVAAALAQTPQAVRAILENQINAHMNRVAQSFGYDGIAIAATYAEEPAVPRFQEDGRALRAWRSLVWAAVLPIYKRIDAGKQESPKMEDLLPLLPEPPTQVGEDATQMVFLGMEGQK